ncbi:hypothetical protein HYT01_02700 [Candidatus Giovannonibacteria bacterium]|nr:hypothetical protein [Candidatus Giovannonibacteria bacterium]
MTADGKNQGRLLSVAEATQVLKKRISNNENIVGETIDGFLCLWGCAPFAGKILSEGLHKRQCLWNYYVSCENCGYQSNLAKYTFGEGQKIVSDACECKN